MKPKTASPRSSPGIRKLLSATLRTRALICINTRASKYTETGYIVGLSSEFLLLHKVQNAAFLNGYVVLPVREIRSFKRERPHITRYLRRIKQLPIRPPRIVLVSWVSLFNTVEAADFLISLHTEHTHPDQCYIGVQAARTDTHVVLYEVDPNARWSKMREYPLADITRVEFGGGYEEALKQSAGSPNERTVERKFAAWCREFPHYSSNDFKFLYNRKW